VYHVTVIIQSASSRYYSLVHSYNPLFKRKENFYLKKDIKRNMTSEVIERAFSVSTAFPRIYEV